MDLYLGLVHHPIRNKRGEVVTTSVTNLDIHDIARSCRTFGVKNYFIVTPLAIQQELVEKILTHWKEDQALAYNPDRHSALEIACHVASIEAAEDRIADIHGVRPRRVVTGANFKSGTVDVGEVVRACELDKRPCFLLFGTGWGLHTSVTERADFSLDPILGKAEDDYNHLSVRSAVAIYLDRFSRF
jgi:hypothetical protein